MASNFGHIAKACTNVGDAERKVISARDMELT